MEKFAGIRDGKKSDPGSGKNIPDPQHWRIVCYSRYLKRNRPQVLLQMKKFTRTEPEFVNLLRSPVINSQPDGIDSLEFISGLLIRLQKRAPSTGTVHAICCNSTVLRTSHCEVLFSQVRQKYPAVQCSTKSLFQSRCCALHSMHSTGGWESPT